MSLLLCSNVGPLHNCELAEVWGCWLQKHVWGNYTLSSLISCLIMVLGSHDGNHIRPELHIIPWVYKFQNKWGLRWCINKDWSWPWLLCMSMVDCYLLHLLFMSLVVCCVWCMQSIMCHYLWPRPPLHYPTLYNVLDTRLAGLSNHGPRSSSSGPHHACLMSPQHGSVSCVSQKLT